MNAKKTALVSHHWFGARAPPRAMNCHAIPDIDLRQRLAERGLECHLLVAARSAGVTPGEPPAPAFPDLLCTELRPLLSAAYGCDVTPEHFRFETWAVTLRLTNAGDRGIVACSTLAFTFDIPSYFHTHFEAVAPDLQRQGIGRLLYDCLAVWARFLVLNDPLSLDGVIRSDGDYCLVSTIDRDAVLDCDSDELHPADSDADNAAGHGTFLARLGFVRALHDFRQDHASEIAFQRAFHVPLEP